MAFRPSYGMHSYPHYPPQQQQIVFGQMRMPGHHVPPQHSTKPELTPAVFVGNISEKCSDEFIQKILNECGEVTSWKRIKGSNGKFPAFGFCTFTDLEGTLRALRILHEFHLGDKKLTVKAEDKIRDELRTSAIENRKKQGKKELKLKPDELPADEDDLKKDEDIRLKILNWMETDHKELFSITEDGEISDELKKARAQDGKSDRHASSTSSHKKDDYKRNRHRRSRTRSRDRNGRRSRSKDSPRSKRSRRSRSSSSSSSSDSSSSGSSYSSRSRSRTPMRSKSSKRRRSNSRGSEDSEDAREKRQIKQMMKEKELAYHARLKRWESRERQMAKKYEREERKEKDKKKSVQKEGKRLKVFLEDYDDEKDDPKYYKSSQFFQRKRDYEREREGDQKDRLQELQEIEELKKQIMAEAANDESINVEEEAKKRHKQKEDEALRKMRADSGSPNPHQPLGQSANGDNGESSSEDESGSEKTETKDDIKTEIKEEPMSFQEGTSSHLSQDIGSNGGGAWKAIGDDSAPNPQITRPVSNGNHSQAQVKKEQSPLPIAQRLNGVFGNDDEEDEIHKKKKLKPFEITREERMQVMSADEKKELTRQIIKRIPTTKEELFVHKIEWDQIDQKWMDDRIRPWVAKKVSSFLGEEDKTLCDYICEQIGQKATPEQLLKDVAVIIDDDAEQFVIKMWRLLIYEGQARRLGIT
uniref:RRM domain-containing protein n=1 Tax=Caenorhabditis tropicalis TaxID=1561998 RepID=A0A1I7SYN1_9PELO